VGSKNTQLLPRRDKSSSVSGLALLFEEPCPLGLQTVFYTHYPSHVRRKGGKDNKIKIWKEAQGSGFEKHAAFAPARQKQLGF